MPITAVSLNGGVQVSEFILPSGLKVELHKPSWGEMLEALDATDKGNKAFANAKCAAIVSSHSIEEIAEFSGDDGFALMVEVNRIFLEVGKAVDLPLGNGSRRSRTGSRRKT